MRFALPRGRRYVRLMEYDEVVEAVFQPSPEGVAPQPTQDASPARRLRDALEPIAMHSVWSRGVSEQMASLGHNFMTAYICSRAALMGNPEPGVVSSAFAVFEPGMLETAYEAGRTLCPRDELLAARSEATIDSLSAVLQREDRQSIAGVANALRQAVNVAPGAGRPLFSGLRNQPWPDQPIGQLWRASEQFREHRGDSHVAVSVAAGLDAVEMNVLTELWLGMPFGSYSASRGWDEVALQGAAERLGGRGWVANGVITEVGVEQRNQLELQTDALQQPIIASLGQQLDPMVTQLAEWSQQCINAKAFPPDAFKRAAG